MQTLLLWLFYLSSFYAFIPGILTRIFGFRVFRRGTGLEDFALTFDDGPDPFYTPRLLDLLKRYNMKATFFWSVPMPRSIRRSSNAFIARVI